MTRHVVAALPVQASLGARVWDWIGSRAFSSPGGGTHGRRGRSGGKVNEGRLEDGHDGMAGGGNGTLAASISADEFGTLMRFAFDDTLDEVMNDVAFDLGEEVGRRGGRLSDEGGAEGGPDGTVVGMGEAVQPAVEITEALRLEDGCADGGGEGSDGLAERGC